MASAPDTRACQGSSFIPRDLWQRACRPSGLSQHRPLRQPPPQRWPASSAQADASCPPAKQTPQQDSEWQFQQGAQRFVHGRACQPLNIVSTVVLRANRVGHANRCLGAAVGLSPLLKQARGRSAAERKGVESMMVPKLLQASEGLASQIAKINELAYTCVRRRRATATHTSSCAERCPLTVPPSPGICAQVVVRRVQPRRRQGAGPQVPPSLPGGGSKV